MIEFRDITVKDKDTITKYIFNSHLRNCDLSFSNLCSWRFMYHTVFAEADGFLILKFWSGGGLAYMMPIGAGNLKKVLDSMISDSRAEAGNLCMLGVCEEMKTDLEKVMPGKFVYEVNENYRDYIYLRTDLANLTGKKYQPKRNHINRFKKTYNYEYAPITPEVIPECLRLEEEWCKLNDCDRQEGTGNERRAIVFALNNFEPLGLTGGILRVDGEIVAFTFGMPINKDTFGVHVEKADTRIDGAYAMINYEFANRIPEQYIYVNREEDLGIEGLRKAKLSYYPVILLEKSMACLVEEKLFDDNKGTDKTIVEEVFR